jgi:hypothetical protein
MHLLLAELAIHRQANSTTQFTCPEGIDRVLHMTSLLISGQLVCDHASKTCPSQPPSPA